jgi:hypothetical protein
MGTTCVLEDADDVMVYRYGSECTSLPTAAYFLDGAVYVGVAVVDKTKGFCCCVEGRCDVDTVGTAVVDSTSGRDDDVDVGTALVERTKGGREDDGVLVGIAVVESVMGGSEDTELDTVEVVELDKGLWYVLELCVQVGASVGVLAWN